MPFQTTRRRALGDVLVQVGSRILNLGLGIVVTMLLARALGDTGFGQWITLLTALQFLAYFTSFGLEALAVREAASDPERAGEWVGALLVMRLALSLPVVIAGVAVVLWVGQSDAMLAAGLILLAQVPLCVGSSLQVVHQLRMRNTVPMAVLTLNSVIWGLSVVVIAALGGGLVDLAIALTAASVLTSLIQGGAALRTAEFRLGCSRAGLTTLLRTGAPLGLAGLLIMAYARVDQFIVFKEAGAAAAGQYGAVYRILEQAHFIPISVLTTVAPMTAALWPAHRERLLRVMSLSAEFMAIGALGALAFTIVASGPLVELLFGPEYAPAAQALPVLCGAFVFICAGYLTGNLLLVLGQARRQVTVGVLALIVNVVGNLLLVPQYGFMAAAWMTLATEVVVVGASAVFVVAALGRPLPGPGRLPRIVASAAALLGVLALASAAGAGLGVLVLLALAAYPLLLLGARAVQWQELRVVLRPGAGG